MSENAEPQQPSAPPPGWAPAPLSGSERPSLAGAPQQRATPPPALGSQPSTTIGEFTAPRTVWPVVIVVVAVLAAVGIWASTTLRPDLPSASKPSPTPVATATASGLPFVSPDERYSGRWEIVGQEWTDSGVELQIRISADRGPVSYSFLAFENTGVMATDPQPSTHLPRMSGFPIATGEEETGWIFMPLARGQATLILANAAGQQMSALGIPG